MNDSRETKSPAAFVAGYPIKHSRSPLIHGYWLRQLGLAGSYGPVEVAPGDFADFIGKLKDGTSHYCGGNVTIPHKEAAFALADRRDDRCAELGAANTLYKAEGLLHATNTDGYGFSRNLDERHPGWDKARKAVVLGAGGASRAVIQALRDRGFTEINVVNRTVARAKELADRFGVAIAPHPLSALDEVMQGAEFFVNTTSLGMDGEAAPPIRFAGLAPGALVTDIVYVPLKTPFLVQAEAEGMATVDGLGMLLHQAVPGFVLWFGATPAVTAELRDLIIADMESHA
ncbi:shikimate dehydrogenase [Rhizobium sp. CG5]|uniref:shikimate dehydrogenase n=1 Tax=Rhizobium sp. CG5 TaxID=2726076 RepID=UPI0020347303|nr:shikimate dehydrogenase [Rhizobium sp. CG5]MCM2476677.1 shikimate dehydrogenase [Rhizobium sp. CG5]